MTTKVEATFAGADDTVPTGLEGVVQRVVVIGAGIAGLTAANAMAQAGVPVVVVEARDRIGGRLHTLELAGRPVDLGGSWIHHPIGNPVRELADAAGIECSPADPLPELAGYDAGLRRRLSTAEVQEELHLQFDAFPAAVPGLLQRLGPDASAADGIEAFIRDRADPPPAARRARQGLRALIEAESADLPERQSLLWMWNELEYGGDYFGDVPIGGYRTVTESLAERLDIRLGFDVKEVEVVGDGVRVTSTTGIVEEGSHAVVTVPLGVLKEGRPRFVPPLPAERLAAIDRLGFGRYEKIVLRFEQPFWRQAGVPHLLLFPADPAESAIWMTGQEAFDGTAALTCMLFHEGATRMEHTTPEDAAAWVLGLLAEVLGSPCPTPIGVAVTGWARDPYSRGSYSHIPPGATPDDADLLGRPLLGRLLFAGEHTQSARLDYVDGAMSSGIREAKRLQGRPEVVLGLTFHREE